MAGVRENDEEALRGLAEDLRHASPLLANHLAHTMLGRPRGHTKRLNSEEAHRIAAAQAREQDRKDSEG